MTPENARQQALEAGHCLAGELISVVPVLPRALFMNVSAGHRLLRPVASFGRQ